MSNPQNNNESSPSGLASPVASPFFGVDVTKEMIAREWLPRYTGMYNFF